MMNQLSKHPGLQRPPAEWRFNDELEILRKNDKGRVPPGWQLSPLAVEKFILGEESLGVTPKFVGARTLITRVIIGLATPRGVMLIGPPGTAKSWLSELLATAISGNSTLIVQGGSITDIHQLLYTWNEQVLSKHGPCREALIPGALLTGMESGKVVRFEEIARCPGHIQDALLSLLSERQIIVPELRGSDSVIFAQHGFNVVATSNSLDKGLHAMSAALKRRLSFETIDPLRNLQDEIAVVDREVQSQFQQSGIELKLEPFLLEALVTIFQELRNGESLDGRSTDRLASSVLSTAEAVSMAYAMGVHAWYYREGEMCAEDFVTFLAGAALKDNRDDRRRLLHYVESELAEKPGREWQNLVENFRQLGRLG